MGLMGSKKDTIVVSMVTFIVICFVAGASADTHSTDASKWAPPNLPGMPGYHEPEKKINITGRTTNWDKIAANWKQLAGKVKEKWGKLTDDEVMQVNGKRQQLEGLLQEKYGYTNDQVKQEVDEWMKHNSI